MLKRKPHAPSARARLELTTLKSPARQAPNHADTGFGASVLGTKERWLQVESPSPLGYCLGMAFSEDRYPDQTLAMLKSAN
jgi:hypothetical protein